jgi:REP element-mobilizing transposase RayT
MANSYTQVYIHFVFAVFGRQNLIRPDWRERLYQYITGIVRKKGHKLISIGGVEDHIHILIGTKPDEPLSKIVQEIKANSSRFINENRLLRGKFEWQKGFGAFSYSRSQIPVVARYIDNQPEHHKRRTFKQEYIELLDRFEVEYDERYLFESYDEKD